MVGLQVAHYSGGAVDVHRHVHIESHALRALDDGLSGVGEVGEAHQLVHLVVYGERGVAKDVRHVSGAQHVHTPAQSQIVE